MQSGEGRTRPQWGWRASQRGGKVSIIRPQLLQHTVLLTARALTGFLVWKQASRHGFVLKGLMAAKWSLDHGCYIHSVSQGWMAICLFYWHHGQFPLKRSRPWPSTLRLCCHLLGECKHFKCPGSKDESCHPTPVKPTGLYSWRCFPMKRQLQGQARGAGEEELGCRLNW